MQEASAVPLRAVRVIQQEFIQAQAAMTQQSLAVQRRALSQQGESLRVHQYLIAHLPVPLEKDPRLTAGTGRMDHTRKEQRNLPDAAAIAVMAMGDTLRGMFPAGQTLNWDEVRRSARSQKPLPAHARAPVAAHFFLYAHPGDTLVPPHLGCSKFCAPYHRSRGPRPG